ncbi:MAG: low specificity L-threonine aldolase [Rhodobiaceae bacterium]|nr:low specificity L-threonine aldolase [Rhodobiaceae bacterium]
MAPVSDRVMQAIVDANGGPARSYGADEWTNRATDALETLFETRCSAFFVATGTAANTLGLAAVTPPWGVTVCHEVSHIRTDECGAHGLQTGGAQLLTLAGDGGKLDAPDLDKILGAYDFEDVHHPRPTSISISQLTEVGCRYDVSEIAAISKIAKRHGMALHMDGARFANAVAAAGCTPAEMSWKAGVDILSFGGTKNGCLALEAIIVFRDTAAIDDRAVGDLARRRMRAGQLLSKGRFLGAQLLSYLEDGHWLTLAGHANSMAAELARILTGSGRARLAWPVGGNEVFAILSRSDQARLAGAGITAFEWRDAPLNDPPAADETLLRFVCSFATSQDDVARVAAILS